MSKQTRKKAGRVIAWILLILLLVLGIALILRFTNNGTDTFKTFYVSQGNQIYATTDTVKVLSGTPAKFEVHYTFDVLGDTQREFKVQVLTYAEKTFDYTVDGQPYEYRDGTDLTEAFETEKDVAGGKFTVQVPLTLEAALEKAYGGEVVFPEGEPDLSATPYYEIRVTSYNEKSVISLKLYVLPPDIELTLDKDHVIL